MRNFLTPKEVLSIILFLLISVSVTAQESMIEIEQKLFKKKYYYEGQLLNTNKKIKNVLSTNDQAYKQYQKGSAIRITGNVMEAAGLITMMVGSTMALGEGFCDVGQSLGYLAYGLTGGYGSPPPSYDCPDSNSETVMIAGLAIFFTGIIFDLTGKSAKQNAIKRYNEDILNKNTSNIELGVSRNGVGLIYRF